MRTPFFKPLTLSHLIRHKLQYLLVIGVVLLGTAGFSAILILNHSILHHFRKSVFSLTAHDLMPIWSESGNLPASYYETLKNLPGVEAVIPIREQVVLWNEENKPIQLRFLDFLEMSYVSDENSTDFQKIDFEKLLSDSKAGLVSKRLFQALHNKNNIAITQSGRPFEFHILSQLPHSQEDDLIIYQDISHSVSLWQDPETVTRYELKLSPETAKTTLQRIKMFLSPKEHVGDLEQRYEQGKRIISSFQVNLLSLSMVSFLVGFFIIYLCLSLSFKQRRPELALLLSLGANRFQLARYLCFEACALGVVGSLLGLSLGYALAQILVHVISQNISQIYFAINADVSISVLNIILTIAMGLVSTLFALIEPLLHIKTLQIAEFLKTDQDEMAFVPAKNKFLAFSLVLWILALLTHLATSFQKPYFSFLTCLFFVLAMVCLVPFALYNFTRLAEIFTKTNGLLKIQDVQKYLFRYSQVSASLVVAFGLTFAIMDMTASFRSTVLDWLSDQFKADVFVSPVDRRLNPFQTHLSEEAIQTAAGMPGIDYYYGFKSKRMPFGDHFVDVYTTHLNDYFREKKIKREKPLSPQSSVIPVYVSENFLIRHGFDLGDEFDLDFGSNQKIGFGIQGYFEDYTSEHGMIVIDALASQSFFPLDQLNVMHIYLKDPSQTDTFVKELKARMPGQGTQVISHVSLRKIVLAIFDQTFVLAQALQWLSFIVAFLGLIINLSLITEARRKITSLLRTMGLSFQQAFALFFTENLIVMIFTLLMAILTGMGLLWILVEDVQKYYFSWLIHLRINPMHWFYTLIFILFLVTVSGFIILSREFKTQPAQHLRYE